MARYTPPPDEPDGVTHTPQEVEDMETEREKFDEWLKRYHWHIYFVLGFVLAILGILARAFG